VSKTILHCNMDRMDTSDSESENEIMMNERIANTNFPPHHQRHYSSADLHTMPAVHMPTSIPSNHQHDAPESPPNDWVFDSDPRLVEGFIDPDGIAARVLTTPLEIINNAELLFLAEQETGELRDLSFALNIINAFLKDLVNSADVGELWLWNMDDTTDTDIRRILQRIYIDTETMQQTYVQKFNEAIDITDAVQRKHYNNMALLRYFEELIVIYLGGNSVRIHRMIELLERFGPSTNLGKQENVEGCNWLVQVNQSIHLVRATLRSVNNRINTPVH